jgi:hypothetical protein
MIITTTRFIKKPHAGTTYGPFIFIKPEYKDDVGLLAHEKLHVKHFLLSLGLSAILYRFSKRYRLWSEVQCYRVQLRYSPNDAELFASFIAERYDLDITKAEALEMLK